MDGLAIRDTVADWLNWAARRLHPGGFERVRLSPLVLKRPLREVMSRRQRMFDLLTMDETEYGLYVRFRRNLRPTKQHPQGRIVTGDFNILSIEDDIVMVASGLDSDAHANGPELIWEHSYPLALMPFISSLVLKRTVEHAVESQGWQATCVSAAGYCQESHAYRFDNKRQDIAITFSEMAQQGRHLHRVELLLSDGSDRALGRFAVDRFAQAAVMSGNISMVLREFVLPMVCSFCDEKSARSVRRADSAAEQQAVVITFQENTFADNEDLETLCEAISQSPGLGVSVVHLNPYLQAQVLDYLSGATVSVIVATHNRMAIVPRSGDVETAMDRICSTVFRRFGEGKATVELLSSAGPGGDE